MIALHSKTSSGYVKHAVHPDAIAKVTQASTSSQWHGIRAIIKLFDGSTLEVSESLEEVLALIEKAKQ